MQSYGHAGRWGRMRDREKPATMPLPWAEHATQPLSPIPQLPPPKKRITDSNCSKRFCYPWPTAYALLLESPSGSPLFPMPPWAPPSQNLLLHIRPRACERVQPLSTTSVIQSVQPSQQTPVPTPTPVRTTAHTRTNFCSTKSATASCRCRPKRRPCPSSCAQGCNTLGMDMTGTFPIEVAMRVTGYDHGSYPPGPYLRRCPITWHPQS